MLRSHRPAWCYLHAGPGKQDFLREARELGAKTLVDVNLETSERSPADVIECVQLADVFVPNEAELVLLTRTDGLESALEAAVLWGTPVVVKQGEGGALIVGPDGMLPVAEGVAPVEVADRTGAGDAFAGGMIAALARGLPLQHAVVAGNGAGSEAVGRLGAVGPVRVQGLSTVMARDHSLRERTANR